MQIALRRPRVATAPKVEAASSWPGWAMPAITTLLSLSQALLVAWFGFSLTGKVDQALKERQATVAHVSAMAKLVDAMYDQTADDLTRRRTVQHLAMYQVDAIGPLVTLAAGQNPFIAEIPLQGLQYVSLRHRLEVCWALVGAVNSPKLIFERNLEPMRKLVDTLGCDGAAR